MNTPTQLYHQHIGRCHRLLNVLDHENLEDIIWVVGQWLTDLEKLKNQIQDEGLQDLNNELFDDNMRAIKLLLEYTQVFSLHDLERYRNTCNCLMANFRKLLREEHTRALTISQY